MRNKVLRQLKHIGLITSLFALSLLSGCTGGVGGSNFDLGKFFSNPIVIFLVIILVIYFWYKGRKK